MTSLTLSIDAMGGDNSPTVILDGMKIFLQDHPDVKFLVHGKQDILAPEIQSRGLDNVCKIIHQESMVSMSAKPASALRKAKGTSMWGAVESVKKGDAVAAVSAGNTGALMAFSMLALRKMKGVYRPAMTALWPTIKGRCVVLDIGANLEADADQLVSFSIMGEAYARAITGKKRPTIGLLNIGSEDDKGGDTLRRAADLLSDPDLGLDFRGFIEGNDISMGKVDVVVTDGFTGNVALKAAEGTAHLVVSYVKDALTENWLSKLGAVFASAGLRKLKDKMNPSRVNGGVLLGLKGVVVKSHGGSDAEGMASALTLAVNLGASNYREEISDGLLRFQDSSSEAELAAE